MDGHEITEIMLSALERTKRIDAEFYKKGNLSVDAILATWNKTSIADSFYVSDGNHMGITDSFCEDGIPYYRGQDIYHLFIETASPLMINRATYDKPQMHRSHLRKNDILMSIVGAIVGNSAMVTSSSPATCSCKLSIMRSKGKDIAPEVLLVYIKTKYGQVQIQKFKRGAAQTGLLLEDFDQLFIPLFGDLFQKHICEIVCLIYDCMQQAVSNYNNAQLLLDNVISLGVKPQSSTTAIKQLTHSLFLTGRLDAEYYQEKYRAYENAVLNSPKGYTYVKNEFLPIKTKCSRSLDSYDYVEIGDIDIGAGSASFNTVNTDDLPDNAKIMTAKGDILVSTVRPNRGAVAILEHDGLLVSGAFTVLREKTDYPKEVLQVLLRTNIYKDWLLRFNVGTSYPVIKDEDVLNMPIPILDDDTTNEVVANVKKASFLRARAKQLLEKAKQAVEIAIEQGEDSALAWLKDKV